MSIRFRKLSYALGPEVSGVDLSKPMTDGVFGEIHRAFLEHCLLLFRGQSFTRAHYVAFSSRFGNLRDDQPGNLSDYPEIKAPVNKPKLDGCTNHNAIGDFERRDQLRFLEKTTLRGPTIGRRYDDPTGTRNMTKTFTL